MHRGSLPYQLPPVVEDNKQLVFYTRVHPLGHEKVILSNFTSLLSSTLPHREGGVENVCYNSVVSISDQSPGLMSPILQHKGLCFPPLDFAFILCMYFEIYDIHHKRF